MFGVKFDVDVAGKPEATFNLWAKGQNECWYHSPKFGDNYLLKLAANGENKFIETDSLYHSTYADLPTSVVLILIC